MHRPPIGSATVRRVASSSGSVALLHGAAHDYEGGTDAGAFSLKLVRGGRATWISRGRAVTLAETMFTFVPAGAPYRVRIASVTPVETACLFFSQELFSAVASSILPSHDLLAGTGGALTDWQLGAAAADARLLNPLVRMVVAADPPEHALVDDVLMSTLPALFALQMSRDGLERIEAVRPSTREELHRRAAVGRDWLLDHLGGHASLTAAARAAAMSPFHFHRTFSAVFGVTPMRYVTERRLERAAFLLAHTSRRVTDISFESGFQSLGSFTTAFTNRFGVAPGRYRDRTNSQASRSPRRRTRLP